MPTGAASAWPNTSARSAIAERRRPPSVASVHRLAQRRRATAPSTTAAAPAIAKRPVGQQIVACQTAANGQCTLAGTGPTLSARHTGAVLQMMSANRAFLAYQPGLTRASVGRVP